ncbi:MAG: DUF3841 domain-containing protein [Marinisporobacter sp.]|jgi:hypothetical protein|nr:DUF3841 domain-containing protein [Marinisporobacter sp.]
MDKEKITLYAAQRKIVLDTIEEKGVYHVKKEYIIKKYGQVAHTFLTSYNWFIHKAEKIVPKPEGAEYPVWLFTDLKYVEHHADTCVLEIKVDRDKALVFDRAKWNRILNLSYIPKDEEDAKAYEELLEKQGIQDETDIYMKNFYPHLKAKVKKSWDRLFDDNIVLSQSKRAALWEIRKEWIVRIIE